MIEKVVQKKDKIYYFSHFNLEALLSLSEHRRGRPCTCDVSQRPKSGSLNWVIFISFDDGIQWVFRSPRLGMDGFYSDETSSKIVESEASTLIYLKTHTSIPVPEVYSFSASSDNDIGVPYILQSKAAGRSLGSYDWFPPPRPLPGLKSRPPQPLPDKDREKVMIQLGVIMAELCDHPFGEIGSIFTDGEGSYVVGECLSPTLTWQDRDELELDRGPFHQEQDYLISLISAFRGHAKELVLTPHTFIAPVPDNLEYQNFDDSNAAHTRWNDFVTIGQKIDNSKNRFSYCIAGQFLLDMIPRLSSGSGSFAICHPDLHLGNLYVDDDFNITCIIDWSSASSAPITELLATPSLGSNVAPAPSHLVDAFRSGFSNQATKGIADISYSTIWDTSDRVWHFHRLVRLLSKNDYEHFGRLFELVYKTNAEEAEGSSRILQLFHKRAKTDENRKLLAELQEEDMTLEEISEQEQSCLSRNRLMNSDAVAVARKLTLISEMNPCFFADRKLWQWIREALK